MRTNLLIINLKLISTSLLIDKWSVQVIILTCDVCCEVSRFLFLRRMRGLNNFMLGRELFIYF